MKFGKNLLRPFSMLEKARVAGLMNTFTRRLNYTRVSKLNASLKSIVSNSSHAFQEAVQLYVKRKNATIVQKSNVS